MSNMLLKDFYTIDNIKNDAQSYTINVVLNAEHEVYKGHFPEQPIVPGVCTMQLVKECVEKIKDTQFCYSQIQSCKFLSVINPKVDNVVNVVMALSWGEDGSINLQADILQREQAVVKLKAVLRQI